MGGGGCGVGKMIKEIRGLLWKVFRLVLWKYLKPILGKVAFFGVIAVAAAALIILFSRGC